MSVTQLNPPIPLKTPRGKGLAHLVIDYGPEVDLIWTVFLDNGEIWSYRNPEVRACYNITMGRVREAPTEPPRFFNFEEMFPPQPKARKGSSQGR